jgi:hypothetical protein
MEAIKSIPADDSLRWNGFFRACMRSKGYAFQEHPAHCADIGSKPQNVNCWQRQWPWQ